MLFGDSTWAGAAWASQALEVTYTNVTVNVTNVPLTLAVNDVSVAINVDVSVTNVPVTITINDVICHRTSRCRRYRSKLECPSK